MNTLAHEAQADGNATDTGIVFAGTRDDYERIGAGLLDKLYALETAVRLHDKP
jgi:hypothetical protein